MYEYNWLYVLVVVDMLSIKNALLFNKKCIKMNLMNNFYM